MGKLTRKGLEKQLDKIVSTYVREKNKWRCQRCGKGFVEGDVGIHAAHIFSRRKKSVRWDTDNLLALCRGCHMWNHGNPVDFALFVERLIGKDALIKLEQKSNRPSRWSMADLEKLRGHLLRRFASS